MEKETGKSTEETGLDSLPPDPVIEAYKKDLDRSLFRENLKLTVQQRIEKLEAFMRFIEDVHGSAGKSPR